MGRTFRVTRWIPVVTLVAGCGSGHAASPPPTPTSPSTPVKRPAAGAGIRTLAPVAKLTHACPLLSAGELKILLGGGASRTRIKAVESRPPGSDIFLCKYGSGGKAPFELVVSAVRATAFSPRLAIAAVVKRHRQDGTRIRYVKGVGEAAAFFTFKDGVAELVASKRSHGQIRMAIFDAPSIVPGRKFVPIVKLVISRV